MSGSAVEIVSYDVPAIRARYGSWKSDANTDIGFSALDVAALIEEIERIEETPSRAALLVAKTEELNLRHRRGWRPSERSLLVMVEDARKELRELEDAIKRDNYARSFPELAHPPALLEAREEVADVFVIVARIAARLGMSFNDLDLEATRKIKLRFKGAEGINV
jgi:hypothetical protein